MRACGGVLVRSWSVIGCLVSGIASGALAYIFVRLVEVGTTKNDLHIHKLSFAACICYIAEILDHISASLEHRLYMLCGVWNSDRQTLREGILLSERGSLSIAMLISLQGSQTSYEITTLPTSWLLFSVNSRRVLSADDVPLNRGASGT